MSNTASPIRKLTDNIYLLWMLLALPGVYLVVQRFILHGKVAFVPLSGEIATYLLIATLMITPLMFLFGPLPWLKTRRRYLGVASCLYGLLHLGFWLINASMGSLLRSFVRPDIITGWVAMAIMVALALTSTDGMVRKMGPRWKALQRWVYPAAILTLAHWLTTTDNVTKALLWCAPLILLSIWRVLRYRRRMSGV
jgi:sulfoxide reductase heme-binding subunit YedZ